MKLAELSTKVEEIAGYLREHDDPHVRFLFGSYTSAFRAYHKLTSNIHHPKQVEVHPAVIGPFNAVYEAYLDSREHANDYPPPRTVLGDPLVVPTLEQYCRGLFVNHNGVIPQRSRIKEGRSNGRKSRS